MPGFTPLIDPSQHTGLLPPAPRVVLALVALMDVSLLVVLACPAAMLLTVALALLFQRHHAPVLVVAVLLPSACVLHMMVVKLLLTTLQAMPPTLSAVMALLPAAAVRELGKPLPLIVTRVPPAKLPVLGLTESTCA